VRALRSAADSNDMTTLTISDPDSELVPGVCNPVGTVALPFPPAAAGTVAAATATDEDPEDV
jgi:hypothetical protein